MPQRVLPYSGPGPLLNSEPLPDDYGQLVRHIGPVTVSPGPTPIVVNLETSTPVPVSVETGGTPVPVSIGATVNTRAQDEAMRVDEASDTTTYVGYAPIGADPAQPVWRIKRILENGSLTLVQWAAAGAQNQIWNARAGLVYA